jgi:hypothetical protein
MTALPMEEDLPADEAQALLTAGRAPLGGTTVERGVARNGQIVEATELFIPASLYSDIERAAQEELALARDAQLHAYPPAAANMIVDRLIKEGHLDRSAARYAHDLVELEVRRGIEHLATDARERIAARLPMSMRSLIPLKVRTRKVNR